MHLLKKQLCRKSCLMREYPHFFLWTINMLSFKWRHFKRDLFLMLVRWYLAYSLSYRDVEELVLERGQKVDHSTINRWVLRYAAQLEEIFATKPFI